MKKAAIFAIALALLMSGCAVGPKEGADAPQTADEAVSAPPQINPEPEETVPTVSEPVSEEYSEPEPDIGEETAEVEKPEPPENPDTDFEVEAFDEPLTLYSTISLNVRKGPSTDYDSIGYLSEGEGATAVGELDGWYMIEFKDGYGFVSGGYMTETPPEEPEENEPEEDEPTQLDPLDHAARAEIVEAYAEFIGINPRLAALGGYYGEYGGGAVVLMYEPISFGRVVCSAAGYDFELDYCENIFYFKDGVFTELSQAYESGLIDEEGIKKARERFIELGKAEAIPTGGVGELEPLEQRKIKELSEDWLEQSPEEYRRELSEMGDLVVKYYGTYGGSEAVLMNSPESFVEAICARNIAGYTIMFNNGNTDLRLHRGAEFFPIETAFLNDYITEDDLAEISYYAAR